MAGLDIKSESAQLREIVELAYVVRMHPALLAAYAQYKKPVLDRGLVFYTPFTDPPLCRQQMTVKLGAAASTDIASFDICTVAHALFLFSSPRHHNLDQIVHTGNGLCQLRYHAFARESCRAVIQRAERRTAALAVNEHAEIHATFVASNNHGQVLYDIARIMHTFPSFTALYANTRVCTLSTLVEPHPTHLHTLQLVDDGEIFPAFDESCKASPKLVLETVVKYVEMSPDENIAVAIMLHEFCARCVLVMVYKREMYILSACQTVLPDTNIQPAFLYVTDSVSEAVAKLVQMQEVKSRGMQDMFYSIRTNEIAISNIRVLANLAECSAPGPVSEAQCDIPEIENISLDHIEMTDTHLETYDQPMEQTTEAPLELTKPPDDKISDIKFKDVDMNIGNGDLVVRKRVKLDSAGKPEIKKKKVVKTVVAGK